MDNKGKKLYNSLNNSPRKLKDISKNENLVVPNGSITLALPKDKNNHKKQKYIIDNNKKIIRKKYLIPNSKCCFKKNEENKNNDKSYLNINLPISSINNN